MGQQTNYCGISCQNGCYVTKALEEQSEVRLIRKGTNHVTTKPKLIP